MVQKTLLVIDDNEDFNTIVKFILEYDTNWKVLTALNGKEGVTKAQLHHPSIILLDVVMPKLTGLDVHNLLKSNPNTCSIPIIFVTAMVTMKAIIELQIPEHHEIITKPFDIMNLGNHISNVYNSLATPSY